VSSFTIILLFYSSFVESVVNFDRGSVELLDIVRYRVPYKFVFNFFLKSASIHFYKYGIILANKLSVLLELSYVFNGRSFLLKVLNNLYGLINFVRLSKYGTGYYLKLILSLKDLLVVLIS
jgi:hypothetical protein